MANKIAVCTISSYNYMAYGLVCLLSAKKYNPQCDFFYLIADKYNADTISDYKDSINFVSLDELGYNDNELDNMTFKYNIIEFNTAIKPKFYSKLFSMGYEKVIYLDPDIECYNPFNRLFDLLDNNSIVVTPHKMSIHNSEFIDDTAFLNNGIYNLGFIGLSKSNNTDEFLKWWDLKLKNQCFIDYNAGMATDQIWVSLASTIFDGFYVTKDPGLNFAFWNFHERKLTKSNNTYYSNDSELMFFHFSSLSVNASQEFVDKLEKLNPGFKQFYSEHITNVKEKNLDKFSAIPYAYAQYDNGTVIAREDRWVYGYSTKMKEKFSSPFKTDENSYYHFIYKSRKYNDTLKNTQNKIEKMLCLFIKIFGIKKAMNICGKLNVTAVKRISKLLDMK